MHLSDLKTKHVTELVEMAAANQIENANRLRKQDLIFALLKSQAKKGDAVSGLGVVGEVAGNDSHRGVEISPMVC